MDKIKKHIEKITLKIKEVGIKKEIISVFVANKAITSVVVSVIVLGVVVAGAYVAYGPKNVNPGKTNEIVVADDSVVKLPKSDNNESEEDEQIQEEAENKISNKESLEGKNPGKQTQNVDKDKIVVVDEDGKLVVVQKNSVEVKENSYVTISVDCTGALDVMTEEALKRVPASGVMAGSISVEIKQGDTVWDVLKRLCADKGFPYRYTDSVFGTVYVASLDNMAEKEYDMIMPNGKNGYSGWCYSVNGIYPNYGCSACAVKDGDVISWKYDVWTEDMF